MRQVHAINIIIPKPVKNKNPINPILYNKYE